MPGIEAGALYKNEILAKNGDLMALKTDPFAFFCEQAPGTAGIVYDLGRYRWNDAAWMAGRGGAISTDVPVSIYEAPCSRTSRKWASLISRCCPFRSIRLTAHGATSRWVCSRRPAVSAGRTNSAISLIAVIRPAEFFLVGLCRRRAERVP